MLDRLTPARRNFALLVLGALVLWFCWTIRAVLNGLILGYLLAFVAHPLVLRLERRGWSRRFAVNVIFVGTGITSLLVGFVVFVQGRDLVARLSDPELHARVWDRIEVELEQHRPKIAWIVDHLPGKQEDGAASGEPDAAAGEPRLSAELWSAVQQWWTALREPENLAQAREAGLAAAGGAVTLVRKIFGSLVTFLSLLVLVPIYTYFLLFELDRIHRFVQRYLPAGERTRLTRIGSQIGEVLSNFFRGRLLVMLLKGLFYTLGLWIAGVDYALLIGMGSGILSIIPFVGSFLGFVTACLVGVLEFSLVGALVRVAIVFGAAEMFENYVLLPKILGDSLSLHPVVVIAAILAGGAAFGVFGLLLALPVTATLVILARELLLPALAQIADGAKTRSRAGS